MKRVIKYVAGVYAPGHMSSDWCGLKAFDTYEEAEQWILQDIQKDDTTLDLYIKKTFIHPSKFTNTER